MSIKKDVIRGKGTQIEYIRRGGTHSENITPVLWCIPL
jgi:hypothetical protein